MYGRDIGGHHFCAGVLIARNTVLTNGQCVARKKFEKYEIHLGRHARGGNDRGRFEVFKPVQVEVHPKYRTGMVHDFDVALVRLDHKADIEPVDLFTGQSCFTGDACLPGQVLAWGLSKYEREMKRSDVLRSFNFSLVSQESCREVFGRDRFKREYVSDAMLCAGNDGQATCQVEAGSPLLVQGGVGGLVSWGGVCGSGEPDVFASISAAAPWIREQLGKAVGEVI